MNAEKIIKALKCAKFDFNYHFSERHGDYIRHNIDVYTEIEGKFLLLQNGNIDHDYFKPSIKLEPSFEGGCDSFFVDIYNLYESDFDGKTDDALEFCEDYEITIDEGLDIYLVLRDLVGSLDQDHYAPEELHFIN